MNIQLLAQMENETRNDRRNREALLAAGHQVMASKGIDAATMAKIAELADVGAGTVYNYFASKDDLAMGFRRSQRDESGDHRSSLALAVAPLGSNCGCHVPGDGAVCHPRYPQRRAAGRYRTEDPELAWRMATHAIVGFSLAVCDQKIHIDKMDDAVVNLLGMVGVPPEEAWEIALRPCPELPSEERT